MVPHERQGLGRPQGRQGQGVHARVLEPRGPEPACPCQPHDHPLAQRAPFQEPLQRHRRKSCITRLYANSQCKFYWQNQGDYLCVKVDRHARKAKSKKATFCNLELFRLREKDYPVEVIEHKDYVPTFAWEPNGQRFAIVSTNDPNFGQNVPGAVIKYTVSFYHPDPKKGDFTAFKHLEGKVANTLMWSPRGRHIVLATMGSAAKCDIEFWDLDFTLADTDKKEVTDPGANVQQLAVVEHYGVTDMAWDPSGRYLASWASAWRSTPEPGFNIWDFKGQQLLHESQDKFKQFAWRNRPATLLSKDQQRKVRKELKEYSRLFEEADVAENLAGSAEKLAQRERDIAEWNTFRKRANERLAAARAARGIILHRAAGVAEDQTEKVEELVEELLGETEEIVE